MNLARTGLSGLALSAGLALAIGLGGSPAVAADVAPGDGVAVEILGTMMLAKEEIGVDDGAFRTLRVGLAPGATTEITGADGEVAVLFVERGAVAIDGEAFHTGKVVTLDGAARHTVENEGEHGAVLLLADVVGVGG